MIMHGVLLARVRDISVSISATSNTRVPTRLVYNFEANSSRLSRLLCALAIIVNTYSLKPAKHIRRGRAARFCTPQVRDVTTTTRQYRDVDVCVCCQRGRQKFSAETVSPRQPVHVVIGRAPIYPGNFPRATFIMLKGLISHTTLLCLLFSPTRHAPAGGVHTVYWHKKASHSCQMKSHSQTRKHVRRSRVLNNASHQTSDDLMKKG